MSYRPITDLWILGRPKVKYYGAYPGGFLSRARALLGVGPRDPVLHVCSGKVREYPFGGFGPNDKTLDADPGLGPDYCIDISVPGRIPPGFAAYLSDPPYTEEDADHYGTSLFRPTVDLPSSSALMLDLLKTVHVGGRVGMLHYEWPGCPETKEVEAIEVAVIAVTTGRRQRMRSYVVMERLK